MQPAPLPPDEARRLEVLRDLGLLDSDPEASFDALVHAAAGLTRCPISLITLVDGSRQWFKAVHGVEARETPRDISLCAHAILGEKLLEVPDTACDARFADNPLVLGGLHIRFYAGEPLMFRGAMVGALCVIDTRPRTLTDDERSALHGLSRVATELLRSRQRMNALHDEQRRLLDFGRASGDWMWETDEHLSYRWVSEAIEAVAGIAPDTLIGQPINHRVPLLDAYGTPQANGMSLGDVLRRRQPFSRALTEKNTRRGLLFVSRSAVPVFDEAGRFRGYRGTARDVSSQVDTMRRSRTQDAAERAHRAKSEFLSRVSHELRTPLNGILGFAQLMSLDRINPLAPEQQRRLDSVLRAGNHLLGLINDVLDLTRIESDHFSPRCVTLDAWSAIDECLSLVQPLAEQAHVHVAGSAVRRACWVYADVRALEQVLMNLLSNAIKYNRRGGTVEVRARVDGTEVRIAIRDDGRGMSAEQQAALFQPFNRLGAEQSRTEGSGLGLVISRRLVEAMGGELQVRSAVDIGSTFTIVLPAGGDGGSSHAAPAFERTALCDLHDAQRDVLYVEDEPLNAVLMEEVFRTRPQWTLRVVEDGTTGARIARESQPDLVLIDMNLPDMNGLTLIRRLRDDPATRPLRCIALSADAMREQIDAALAAGFDDYWTKPIDVHRVLSDLSRLLAEPAAQA